MPLSTNHQKIIQKILVDSLYQLSKQNKCFSLPVINTNYQGFKFLLFSFSMQILSSSSFSLNVISTNLSFLRWELKIYGKGSSLFLYFSLMYSFFLILREKDRSSLFWWLLFLIPGLGAEKFHSLDWSGRFNSNPSSVSFSLTRDAGNEVRSSLWVTSAPFVNDGMGLSASKVPPGLVLQLLSLVLPGYHAASLEWSFTSCSMTVQWNPSPWMFNELKGMPDTVNSFVKHYNLQRISSS